MIKACMVSSTEVGGMCVGVGWGCVFEEAAHARGLTMLTLVHDTGHAVAPPPPQPTPKHFSEVEEKALWFS